MSHSTRLSRDALRWLRAKQHDLLPLATSTSRSSSEQSAGDVVVATALMSPINSELYRVAVRATNQGWRTRVGIPLCNDWPADQAVLKGHAGNVTAVVFSPDGRQLVSGSGGGHELRVWDISSGTCTAVLLVRNTVFNYRARIRRDKGRLRVYEREVDMVALDGR